MSPKFGLPGRGKTAESAEPAGDAVTTEPAVPAARIEPAPMKPLESSETTGVAAIPETAPVGPAEPAEPVEPAPEPAAQPEPAARASRNVGVGLAQLAAYERAVLSWVAADGYPMNVDIAIDVRLDEGAVRFNEPIGFILEPGATVAITGSRIRMLPNGGFEGRSHVTVWGLASARPRARFAVNPTRAWFWDEDELPPEEAYERDLPKARRYFDALSAERTEPVRPRPPSGLIAFRVLHAPFLGATFAPVLLGLAVAARAGVFDAATAAMTLAAVCAVHFGLNVGSGLFDTLRGEGEAGAQEAGSEGRPRGLVTAIRQMSAPVAVCYAVAIAVVIALLVVRGSPALVVVAAVGLLIGTVYALPPFRLAHRGLDEVATAVVFGPVVLVGTYLVQSHGAVSPEAFALSVPVGLLAALIVYVNEIRRRAGDAKSGRRTLPVRLPQAVVVAGFSLGAGIAYVGLVAGVALALLPIPVLIALLTIPLAVRIRSGLLHSFDEPHALLNAAAEATLLHTNVSLILLLVYLLTIADQVFLNLKPYLR